MGRNTALALSPAFGPSSGVAEDRVPPTDPRGSPELSGDELPKALAGAEIAKSWAGSPVGRREPWRERCESVDLEASSHLVGCLRVPEDLREGRSGNARGKWCFPKKLPLEVRC